MGILQARILEWVALLQGIFPTQGSNGGLLHCKQILYQLSYPGSIYIYESESEVAQSCPTLCDSMDCSTPGFPVLRKENVTSLKN